MGIMEIINSRFSVRGYKPDPVEDEKLTTILNSARMAPTASNRQPFNIIVIQTKGREEELRTIYQRDWFVQAPLILCICGLAENAWVRRDGRQFLFVDVGIVMDHMVLTATELGLGTCIVAAFDVLNARRVLSIPDEIEPILFTPLGYPLDTPRIKQRKNLEELVKYDRWIES
jgi:nitroreductase